jgi:hypothetical protein
MKAAIEAMRNKETGSYKVSRFSNLPKRHYSVMLEPAESSSEAIKQNWVESKFFFVK